MAFEKMWQNLCFVPGNAQARLREAPAGLRRAGEHGGVRQPHWLRVSPLWSENTRVLNSKARRGANQAPKHRGSATT